MNDTSKNENFITQENTIEPLTIGYTYIETIGKGAFGEVKLMKDSNNVLYAVKEIDKKKLNEGDKELIKREVIIHKRLKHSNIIQLLAVSEDTNVIRLLLEYAADGNLFNFIRKKGVLKEEEVAKIFYGVAKGVRYLHSKKVIHRDLKPENILLIGNTPKIIDFGWSVEAHNKNQKNICGTLEYMAPEVVYNGDYGSKIDIWALGILLYEMLHGHAPVKAKCITDMVGTFSSGLNLEFRSDISPLVKELINDLLKFDPDGRPEIEDVLHHPWLDSELTNDESADSDFQHNHKQCKKSDNSS